MSKITKALERAKQARGEQLGNGLSPDSEANSRIRIRKRSKRRNIFYRKSTIIFASSLLGIFILYAIFYLFIHRDPVSSALHEKEEISEKAVSTAETTPVTGYAANHAPGGESSQADDMVLEREVITQPVVTPPRNRKVATFDSGRKQNELGGDFATWRQEEVDRSFDCEDEFNSLHARLGEGLALRLVYNVNHPAEDIENGLRMDLADFPLRKVESLSFYIKGDREAGFTEAAILELRGNHSKGRYSIRNITDRWEKVEIPLQRFKEENTNLRELRIIFRTSVATKKQGAIFIDDIYLNPINKSTPSAS